MPERGLEALDAPAQCLQLSVQALIIGIAHLVDPVQLAQYRQQLPAQLDIGAARGRVLRRQVAAQILLQVLGILDRIDQLQRRHLFALPIALVRFVHRQVETAHERQQVAVNTFYIALIQRIGIGATAINALAPALVQRLILDQNRQR